MDLDIIVQNKKNKILVIGPSSSGKSTLMHEWITKGLVNKKEICFAYQYNIIKKYTTRIFHYNLLKCYEDNNSSDINTDKLLEKILTIKPLFVYILFTNEEELENRISRRRYNEYEFFNEKKLYKREKRLEISRNCNYIELYKSLIQLLEKKKINYSIFDSTNPKFTKITYDKIY
jgi:guanylate kinase